MITAPSVEQPCASRTETAQQRFDRIYVTSTEICRTLQVSRAAVLQARRRCLLPDPVSVRGAAIFVWERSAVQPYVDAWGLILRTRRSSSTQQPV